jgi:ApbE superfamily uncharacterized protein (UPF0280 family)
MFGIEPAFLVGIGALALVAGAVAALLRRRIRPSRDDGYDWDVGGDIV